MINRLFYFLLIAALTVQSCNKYYQASSATTENLRVRTSIVDDASTHPLQAIILPYKASLDEQMNTVIGSASKRLYKERPESTLGNWITDAIQNQVNRLDIEAVDLSVQNYGGIRISEITPGDITVGKVYELMPFDNMVVVVEMSGRMTQRFFDHMAAGGGWPLSKEASYVLQQDRAKQLRINGKAIESDQTYRIALPDYVANGGNNCDFLMELPRENTGFLVRDLLIKEVIRQTEAGSSIEASIDGRVIMGD